MYSADRLVELKRQREAESVFQTHSDERQQEAQEIRRLQQSRDARENREAQQARPINRLGELKRRREEDPQAYNEARAQRQQRMEDMRKQIQAQQAQRIFQQEARRAREAREHAALEERRTQEAHAARQAQETHAALAARRAEEAQRVVEQEAQLAQRAREAQCAQDLEDAKELAEIQEYEALSRALAQSDNPVTARRVFGPLPQPVFRPSPFVASVAPASATLLQSAVESARQALLYADKVRRDIFLEEREERLRQLALTHERRMRAECERVDRGVTVAPIEYILGFQRPPRGGPEPVNYMRVLLGSCNLTFNALESGRYNNKLTGIQWEAQYRDTVVPWLFWNPVKGGKMVEIDPDFQDDVFILPHFREEIATHLETHSLIHAANRENWFFLGPNMSGLDASFVVTLKFLARMKKLNRLEFATISAAI